MKTIRAWEFVRENASGAVFRGDGRHLLYISCLEDGIFRVRLERDGKIEFPRTWAIEWGHEVPFEGRARTSLTGFSNPQVKIEKSNDVVTLVGARFSVRVHLRSAHLEWIYNGQSVLRERKTGAVGLGDGERLHHFHEMKSDSEFYGLGEVSGPLNKRGRRYEMRNVDAMGYDAELTDPLYKHFPFLIHRSGGVAVGVFYDNFSTTVFDCGKEIDNYHGPFFSYHAECGDLDYYVILGPQIADVTRVYTKLTGRAMLPPKWSLGYSGSTMTYTDAPDAQKQLGSFLSLLSKHEIPCESFHLSSGYTSIGSRRYVFNWNRDKIPSPETLIANFKSAGVRFVPNIKPVLLTDHPKYQEAKEFFVKDASGAPELSQFWDGLGSHLDFSNPETVTWWKKQIREQLVEKGIESLWNDNNEFEVWEGEARCFGQGESWAIKNGRAIQTLLMAMASREALREAAPSLRPFVVSRSGMPGMQRYVQTWSGDNYTAWKTLRYNLAMALGLGLSGVANTGHDIGGFSGPMPSPELFLRWIQHGIFYPRFVIHSWKDGAVNEPWMYPEVLPQIREAMRLRESLKLYFYNVLKESSETFTPFLRPLFFDFEKDPESFKYPDLFMVGRDLLVANVFDEAARSVDVYLPQNAGGWFDFRTGQHYDGGLSVRIEVVLGDWPVFVRAGAVLPVLRDGVLELRIYPSETSMVESQIYDDDGLSYPISKSCELNVTARIDPSKRKLKVETSRLGEYTPEWKSILTLAPKGWQVEI